MSLDIETYNPKIETIDLGELKPKEKLPNATAVLVLGIISIAICTIGFVTGIIALALASGDMKQLKANPDKYSESSAKNLRAGRICAIVGLSLSVCLILFYVLYFIFILSLVDSFGGVMEKAIENQQNMPID